MVKMQWVPQIQVDMCLEETSKNLCVFSAPFSTCMGSDQSRENLGLDLPPRCTLMTQPEKLDFR